MPSIHKLCEMCAKGKIKHCDKIRLTYRISAYCTLMKVTKTQKDVKTQMQFS